MKQLKKKIGPKVGSDVLYKKIIEHMNEGVWMGDEHEKTVYANPKFCKMMGYSLEEMLGKESYIFWDEVSAKTVKNVNTSKRKKGISSSYEGNLLTKDKKRIPVLLSGTPLPDGGTIGIMTDLTKLKEKEEKEKILNSAIHYANDAIIIFDKNGKITSWNRGAVNIFGYKKNEVEKSKIENIFTKDDINNIFENYNILHNVELFGLQKNKKKVKISATLTPISDDIKDHKLFLLIGRDITNQAKFEEELALKYEKIKDAYNKFGLIRRQMDYIFELMDLCSGFQDNSHVADYIVSSIIMLTKVDACVLRKFNPKEATLDLLSHFGVTEEWEGKSKVNLKNSLTEKAFNERRPLKIIDITTEPKYHSAHLARKNNLCSLLLIPLIFKGNLIGSLSLYTTPERKLEIFENEFIEKYAKLIEMIVATMF